MPKPGPKVLTDLRELRALAHPLRRDLFTELLARGEATVSELANAVQAPVNKVSFHLQQLAKYGFIEPAPERARDRRDRWWRPMYDDGVDWGQLAGSVAGKSAVRSQLRHGLDETLAEIRSYFVDKVGDLPEWPRGSFSHDWYLRMTPDEAAAFDAEYLQLCRRWRDRTQDRASMGDDAERASFAVFIYGFPQRGGR